MWEGIKKDLNLVFEKHTKNIDALSPNGSTQSDGSFNLVVASKDSKMHHYSISESLDFGIASAVCQKNIGQTCMTDTNTTIG